MTLDRLQSARVVLGALATELRASSAAEHRRFPAVGYLLLDAETDVTAAMRRIDDAIALLHAAEGSATP